MLTFSPLLNFILNASFQLGLLNGKTYCSLKIQYISDIHPLMADKQEFMSSNQVKKNSL